MNNMLEKDIYKSALKMWGKDAQLQMVVEECSELIKAVMKYKRNPNNKTVDDVIEEMADVEIMLSQLKIIFETGKFGCFTFYIFKNKKLKRLENLVESYIEKMEKV